MITGLFLSECDQTAHRWVALWTFYRKSFGSGWMRPSDGRQIGQMHQGKWRALLPEPDFSWILRTNASPDRLALKNKSVELVETYRFDCKMIAMWWTVAEKIIFNEPQLTSFCCNFFLKKEIIRPSLEDTRPWFENWPFAAAALTILFRLFF